MSIFETQSNKRTQKMHLNDIAKVNDFFKPGTIFKLEKSEQQRKIIGKSENNSGWFKIEVLWGEKWIPGAITHQVLQSYLKKNEVYFKRADQYFYKPSE